MTPHVLRDIIKIFERIRQFKILTLKIRNLYVMDAWNMWLRKRYYVFWTYKLFLVLFICAISPSGTRCYKLVLNNPTKYTIFTSKVIRTPMFENFLCWRFFYEWQPMPLGYGPFCGRIWFPLSRQANDTLPHLDNRKPTLISSNTLASCKIDDMISLIATLIPEHSFIITIIIIVIAFKIWFQVVLKPSPALEQSIERFWKCCIADWF